jgi:hypothetical protein
MATGDTNDIVNRLRAALPPWFPDPANSPVLQSVLTGVADLFGFIYAFLGFAALQTRIATMVGGFLDMAAWDFFGSRFTRRFGETDLSWQPRVIAEILRPRQTKAAIIRMLKDLTGSSQPIVLEFFNPQDAGGYGVPQMGGYGTGPGFYGSLQYPNQIFITAYRAPTQGIPNANGYGGYNGGYGVGTIEYGSLAFVTGPITDAEIYARIAQTTAAGITPWTVIQNPPAVLVTEGGIFLINEGGTQLASG